MEKSGLPPILRPGFPPGVANFDALPNAARVRKDVVAFLLGGVSDVTSLKGVESAAYRAQS